MQLNTDANWDN